MCPWTTSSLAVMDLRPLLLIFCCLTEPVALGEFCKKQFSQILVRPGNTVTMPCRFTIDAHARSKTSVSWQKANGTDDIVVAFSSIPEEDANQDQNYKGRARIQPEWPNSGHPDLMLYNVFESDMGNYTCFITVDNWPHKCSNVLLKLDVRLTGKDITIITAAYVLLAVAVGIIFRFVC